MTLSTSRGTCDSGLTEGWYRASSAISTSPPGTNQCQTHAPGWLNFNMPSSSGSTTSGTACFHWTSSNCQWSVDGVQATNCGDYYVYYLKPAPACSLRYCP